MGPPSFMERIGLAATDAQARVAAEYFSSIDFKPWIRVVETDMVPETRFSGWIHKVVEGGGMEPRVGNNCLFMVGAHVAHDCHIYSNVILANNATLAGHVTIHNNAILGGLSAVHQFVSIGKYAMIGGMSGVGLNIIPYGLYLGIRDNLRGLNLIGLKRKNVDTKTINKINKIFKKIFCDSNSLEKRLLITIIESKKVETDRVMLNNLIRELLEHTGNDEVEMEVKTENSVVKLAWPLIKVAATTELAEYVAEILGDSGYVALVGH